MLEYRVIPKADIPDPDPLSKENYGEWARLMRLMRLLSPQEAVELEIDGLDYTNVIGSIHCAAKKMAVRVRTMRKQGRLYIVRTGLMQLTPARKCTITCAACGSVQPGRAGQRYCLASECQAERHRRNLRTSAKRKAERNGN